MEVRWSALAADDLDHIYHYIAGENPEAARRVVRRIFDTCEKLSYAPGIGRISRIRGRRELTFAPLPFIVVYQITDEAVEISRVYHGAQDWP